MKTRTIITTTALTLSALTIPATAAWATGSQCTTYTHDTLTAWTIEGGATVELLDKGVKIVTPETPSRAGFTVLVDVPAKSLKSASYQTFKYDNVAPAALPAYRITLDVDDDGTADGTIVYEPYYQIVGNPAQNTAATWQVLDGKFWTSSDKIAGMVKEGGGSYAGNKTWTEILAANPEAQVLAYGIGQGTYNAGASARVNEVRFAAHSTCVVQSWAKPPVKPTSSPTGSPTVSPTGSPTKSPTTGPTGSPTGSPTASPTGSPSATGSPTPSKSTSKSPVVVVPANNSEGLPNTGSPVKLFAVAGLLLAAAGAVLVFMRRRKTRFEA